MRVGDIKVEALKLMYVTDGEDIRAEDLADLGGLENYRDYLVGMHGAINRCFSDLECKRVLPIKSYPLNASDGLASASAYKFDLASLLPDFFDVARIVRDAPDGYNGSCDFVREGNVLILHGFDRDAEYRVLYYPKLARLTPDSGDLQELPIPDEIAAFIPYFLKGELYRDDEPNEASEARNWYEAAMEQIALPVVNNINRIGTVYSQV